MQAALRSWLHRVATAGAGGLCGMPAPALLSVLCASALSPLIAAIAGIGATGATLAGSNILSSFGSGILSGIITDALEQARSKDVPHSPGEADDSTGLDRLSGKVAAEIDRILTAGDANTMALRAEIASLLAAIDEGGTILGAALEEQGEQVRAEVLAAIAELGSDFTEMDSHLGDVAKTAAAIQSKLDDQGAGVQSLIGQSRRQSDDIGVMRKDLRVIRKDVAGIVRRTGGMPSPSVAARGRHQLIGLAILVAAVAAALVSIAVLPIRSLSGQAAAREPIRSSLTGVTCTPRISSVTPLAAAQTQNVVIKGTCFGTGGPIAGNSDDFEILDLNGPWTACSESQNDPITCDITKWTSTSIVLNGLAGYYGSNGQELNTDDRVRISVENRQGGGSPTSNCVVIVGQPGTTNCDPGCIPKIDSVSQFAAVQTQTVVIKGSCFGSFGGISAGLTDDNSPFFVITDNSGPWSGCGINDQTEFRLGVACYVSKWSPTSIIFRGFGDNYGLKGWIVNQWDNLVIKVRNVRNYSSGICNVIAGASGVTACHSND